MLRLLADENLNGDIVRGLRLRSPGIDLVRVQDCGIRGFSDPAILEWAGENGRIVLSHDKATLPDFAYDRVLSARPMPGVFIVSDRLTVRQAIDDILLADAGSEMEEWENRVLFLPL